MAQQLLTTNFRVATAQEFVNSVVDEANTKIYAFVGRSLTWPAIQNTDVSVPSGNLFDPVVNPITTGRGVYSIAPFNDIRVRVTGGPPNSNVTVTKTGPIGAFSPDPQTDIYRLDSLGSNTDTNQFFIYEGTYTYTIAFTSANSYVGSNIRTYTVTVTSDDPATYDIPDIINCSAAEKEAWQEMIAMKKISPGDVKLVVPRYDWATGTAYSRYSDKNANLLNHPFYVLVLPQYQVYLCIDNNNGAISTSKPGGTSINIFQTSDGYKWKYIYSLSDADILKFLTLEYMPVSIDNDVFNNAIGGTINSFDIADAGAGYPENATLQILGDGTGFSGTPIVVSNAITGVNIITAGVGYTNAKAIVSGGGFNANLVPILSPVLGHGRDLYETLGARYVMINSRLNYAEGGGDFPVVNDYRKIGLIKNPKTPNGLVANTITLDAAYTVNCQLLAGTFVNDERITGNIGFSNAYVLSANVQSPNVIVRYVLPPQVLTGNTDFCVGERITGVKSGASGRILSISQPEVSKDTGKILYIENRSKISRSNDQAENIHIVIEF